MSEEAKYPKDATTELRTYFPNVLGVNQFLEVLAGHNVQFFNQAQYPYDFLGLLARQGVQELLDRAISGFGSIEVDCSHTDMLAEM